MNVSMIDLKITQTAQVWAPSFALKCLQPSDLCRPQPQVKVKVAEALLSESALSMYISSNSESM